MLTNDFLFIDNLLILRIAALSFVLLVIILLIKVRTNFNSRGNWRFANFFGLIETELRSKGRVSSQTYSPGIWGTIKGNLAELLPYTKTRNSLKKYFEKRSSDWDIALDEADPTCVTVRFKDEEKVKTVIDFRDLIAQKGYQEALTGPEKEMFITLILRSVMAESRTNSILAEAEVVSTTDSEEVWVQTDLNLFQFLSEPEFEAPVHCFISNRTSVTMPDCNVLMECIRNLKKKGRYIVVISSSTFSSEILYFIKERIGKVFAYDMILLDLEAIFSLSVSADRIGLLRQFVISQIDLSRVSPFTITGPTTDRMFYGREQELRLILENIEAKSFTIIGGRRIGKSSMIVRLHRILFPASNISSAYIDLSTINSYTDFLETAIPPLAPDIQTDFPTNFKDLLNFRFSGEHPFICLLFDEADKVVSIDRASGWKIFKALRAIANSGTAQVILTGEQALREALRNPQSPLFNFSDEIILHPLDYNSVEELVTQSMKQLGIQLAQRDQILLRIFELTSGHPNIVQRLCRRLVENVNQKNTRVIDLQAVEDVFNEMSFRRDDYLGTIWESATPLEKIIALLLVENRGARTSGKIKNLIERKTLLKPRAKEVDDALQRLIDLRSILKVGRDGYSFAYSAFPTVIASTLTVDDILSVLIDEYKEQV